MAPAFALAPALALAPATLAASQDASHSLNPALEQLVAWESEYQVVSNPFFSVVSRDGISAAWVADRGERIWELLEDKIPLPRSLRAPLPVDLINRDAWTLDAPYLIAVNAMGRVTLDLRWAADTQQDTVELALLQLILTKALVLSDVTSQAADIPPWLLAALYAEVLHRRQPGFRDIQMSRLRKQQALPLQSIIALEQELALVPANMAECYCLYLWVQREAGRRAPVTLAKLLAARQTHTAIRIMAEGKFSDSEALEAWWKKGRSTLNTPVAAPFESMGQSRARLEQQLTVEVEILGQLRELNFEAALERIDKYPEVALAVDSRIRQALEGLRKVNPVYYNVQLSIGQAWEAAKAKDQEAMQSILPRLEQDLKQAYELQDTLEVALIVEERMQQKEHDKKK